MKGCVIIFEVGDRRHCVELCVGGGNELAVKIGGITSFISAADGDCRCVSSSSSMNRSSVGGSVRWLLVFIWTSWSCR